MRIVSRYPYQVGEFDIDLPEVMYYLYLPVQMDDIREVRLPPNLRGTRDLILRCLAFAAGTHGRLFRYAYISARKGWATPDNPLNRPGWHADGFGSTDLNFVWWRGPGTRFAVQDFDVDDDHVRSLEQFAEQVDDANVLTGNAGTVYMLTPDIVHATPLIEPPGCSRQYIKVSLSDQRYNLKDNSHNYLYDYDWEMHPRSAIRNDTQRAGLDYLAEGR